MRRIFLLAILFIFFAFFQVVFAENIDTDNGGNDFAVLEFDNSQISFDCTSCNVTVSDSDITGYAWGESVGWVNLQPGSSGVSNDGNGNLSGYAWGENTGWINFDPTFGGVSISNGEFDGYAWSENYGWIQFDCGVSGACVKTSWVVDISEEGGGGSGSSPTDPIFGCTNNSAENYNPQATSDNGSCIFSSDVIFGCTVTDAVNYNPEAEIDDNSCQFGDIEIPDNPDEEPIDIPDDNNTDGNGEESTWGVTPDDSGQQGGGISAPQYNFSKINAEDASKILPLLMLGLSLLTIPFQQMLQIPSRAVQLVFSWFGIGRKKTWGIVFDSITKQALDPVVVALKDMQGTIIQTSITDMEGRYGFITKPGLYSLEAHKADYSFPSQKLAGKHNDGLYEDLYFGGTFQVLEEGEIITKNIPLDAEKFNWNEYEKARLGLSHKKTFWEKLQKYSTAIFIFGFTLSIIAVFILPVIWNYLVLIFYIIAGSLQMLGLSKHAGSVTKDNQPLSFGVMRVFSNSLKKEMKKVVLDNLGNYYCLIRNGEYYITLEERKEDGSYQHIYTSDPFKVRNGAIRKNINI